MGLPYKKWHKAILGASTSLLVAIVLFGQPFGTTTPGSNLKTSVVDFTSSALTITDLTSSGETVWSGSEPSAVFTVNFIDPTGLGNLTEITVNLTPAGGATFTNTGITSSFLEDQPLGLQLWKDSGGEETFDTGDVKISTSAAKQYSDLGGGVYAYDLELSSALSLSADDTFFVVYQTDNAGVADDQSVVFGIPANGFTTSGTSPSTTAVSSYAVTMDAATPKVVSVNVNGDLSLAGTTITLNFDQAMSKSNLTWAYVSEPDETYNPEWLFYAQDPATYTWKTFGTGATAEFGTNQVADDTVTITLGTGSAIEDGNTMWVNFSNLNYGWVSGSITIDTSGPQLDSVLLVEDAGADGQATQVGDVLMFVFDESIDISTLDVSNIGTRLTLSAGTLTTTVDPTVTWISSTRMRVSLNATQTNSVGATVSIANTVKDENNNAATNSDPLPTVQVVSVYGSAYVYFVDNDATYWGIDENDIHVEWGTVSSGDHINVYILPSTVAFDFDTHNKINSSPIAISAIQYDATTSSSYIGGDSRSNYSTYYPYYYFTSDQEYIAYVVVCADAEETVCSMETQSNAITFGSNDGSGGDYYDDYNWQSVYIENSVPWYGSTVATNYKTFSLVFSDSMDATTITSDTLTLTVDGDPITGTVSYDSDEWIATFTATGDLPASSTLLFSLSSSARDADGNNFSSYSSYFYTSDSADNTGPTVSWAYPYNDQTSVDTLSSVLSIGFSEPLDSSTVTSSSWSASPSITASTFYDPSSQAINLEMDNSSLLGNTEYTITIEGSVVTDASGNAMGSDYTYSFTTGAANTSAPQVTWVDFRQEGFEMGFDLGMKESTVTNSANFTLVCNDTPVSLSGANFYWDSYWRELNVSGVPLADGCSCTLTLSADIKGTNNVSLAEASRTQTGSVATYYSGDDYYTDFATGDTGTWFVMDDGYDNTYDMPSVQFWNPMNAFPDNTIAGMTADYTIEFPITQALSDGYKLRLTFPTGFDVSGVTIPSDSWENRDINNWVDGEPSLESVSANQATRTITLTLNMVDSIGADGDQLRFRLGDIVNSSTPSSMDNGGGYTVQVETLNSSGQVIEGPLDLSPFWLNEPGNGAITVNVLNEDTDAPIVGAVVYVYSSAFGQQQLTTDALGQVSVTGIPIYSWGTDISSWMDGNQTPDGYVGNWNSAWASLTEASPSQTQTLYLSPADLQITGTITHPGVGADGETQISVWASGMNWVQKPVTLDADGSTAYTLYLAQEGYYSVGFDKYYDMNSGYEEAAFVTPSPQQVNLTEGTSPLTVNATLDAADKTISGTVIDQDGAGLSGAWVNVNSDQAKSDAWFWAGGQTDKSGNYSIAVGPGSYNVNVYVPGMSGNSGKNIIVREADSNVDVDFVFEKPTISVTGTISDGTNGIQYANVNCYSQNGSYANGFTDSSGNFVFFVNSGTWNCDAWAPELGMVPAATGVDVTDRVISANVTGLNFTYDPDAFATLTGTVLQSDSTVMTYGWLWVDKVNSDSKQYMQYVNGGQTGSDGTFSIKVPKNAVGETYMISMWDPNVGHAVLDNSIDASAGDVALGTLSLPEVQDVTIIVTDVPGNVGDLSMNFFNTDTGSWSWANVPLTDGDGTNSARLQDGDYIAYAYVWGLGEFQEELTVSGSATSVTFDLSSVEIVSLSVNVIDDSGTPLSDIYVEAFDPTNNRYNSTYTDADGDASMSVISGTYYLKANQYGYISSSAEADTSSDTSYDLVLTAADAMITGTVTDESGNPVSYVWVDAETTDGSSWTSASTNGSGEYTLQVASDTTWDVYARSWDGTFGTESDVDDGDISADVILDQSFDYFVSADPFVGIIDPTQDNVITSDLIDITASSGALSDDANGISLEFTKTTAAPNTDTSAPLGNFAIEVGATDSNDNEIILLGDDVLIEVKYDKTQVESLIDNDVIEVADLDAPLGYYNETSGSWVILDGASISVDVQDDSGDAYTSVTMADFIAGYDATYSTYSDYTVNYSANTDHFTLFGPVVTDENDATAPSAPTGLTATAGNGQVVLNWADNSESDFLEYSVYRNTSSTVPLTNAYQINTSAVTASTYTDSAVTAGTTYYYVVTASDTAGNESASSSTVNGTPTAGTSGGTIGGSSGDDVSDSDEEVIETEDETMVEDETVIEEESVSEIDETITTGETEEETVVESGETDYVGHWAQTYIEELFDRGVVSGCGDNDYCPDQNITRAEVVKIALNLYELPVVPGNMLVNPFSDMEESHWAYDYILSAYANGLITGYADGTFNPDAEINRAEAVKIMLNAADVAVTAQDEEDNGFADVVYGTWYYDYVIQSYEAGVLSGYEENGETLFKPAQPITRGELAKVGLLVEDL